MKMIGLSALLLSLAIAISLVGCGGIKAQEPEKSLSTESETESIGQESAELRDSIDTEPLRAEEYRGFQLDNVLHSSNDGDIHYHIYIPESYDGSEPYALFVSLPGYEGLYFQGVGVNLESEEFAFEAQKYKEKMIIAAPQLDDWGETSANQTIALTRHLIDLYNIDANQVYANGYSDGGETMSLVLEKTPELFTAYLHCSSRWDGAYEPVAENRLPVYLAVGENDEYYGSEPTRQAYEALYGLYREQGLSEEEIAQLLVLDVKPREYFTERGITNKHGGGVQFAFDEEIMGWLFSR